MAPHLVERRSVPLVGRFWSRGTSPNNHWRRPYKGVAFQKVGGDLAISLTLTMRLHLKSNLSLEHLAKRITELALPDFERQLRDGLNLGGGEYFKFFRGETEILLVCNDADHADVFIESRKAFPYYCYVWRGPEDVLERMLATLTKHGFECELEKDQGDKSTLKSGSVH